MVSLATTQLYCGSIKAAINSMFMNKSGCIPIKVYLQKQEICFNLPVLFMLSQKRLYLPPGVENSFLRGQIKSYSLYV